LMTADGWIYTAMGGAARIRGPRSSESASLYREAPPAYSGGGFEDRVRSYGAVRLMPFAWRSGGQTKDFPGSHAGNRGNPLEGFDLRCLAESLSEPLGDEGYHRYLKGVRIFVQDPLLPMEAVANPIRLRSRIRQTV